MSAALTASLVGADGWWVIQGTTFVTVVGCFLVLDDVIRRRQQFSRLSETLRRFRRVVPDVLFEATGEGVFRSVNAPSSRILGIPHRELRGRSFTEFTADPLPPFPHGSEEPVSWTTTWTLPDGSVRSLNTLMTPVWDPNGNIRALHGVIRDQAERVAAEVALLESEVRFRRVLDAAQNGIMLVSHEGQLLLTNNALHRLLGYPAAEMPQHTLAEIVHPAYVDQLMALMASRAWSDAAPSHYEIQLVRRNGDLVEVEVSLAAFRERDRNTGVLVEVRDLTEARRATDAIRHMSDYDRLTGLPNRDLFDRHLQRAIIDAKATHRHVAVVLIDLDRFKLINDTLGHPSGDRLLRAVAERLRAQVPPRHLVARFSGDEYLVLCPDLATSKAAEFSANRVISAFTTPFELDGHLFQVSATAGVALYPDHAEDSATLVRIADGALHEAKINGGNTFHLGSSDANDPALRRLELEADLHRAVEQGDLELHYQPQVDPETGDIRALEALLRWTHPVHGPVSPSEFIPLLEETGLIVEVGDYVLRAACVQAQAWRNAGHPDLRIAVNLSPRQFLVSDLDARIRAALEFAGLPPEALEVELTETAGLLDLDSVSGVLNSLIELGVTTAIDDFGIGQSWLGRLQQFSIRTLKVDRSFIARMEASSNDLAIVQAVVALGHALGMTVVAEGVETSEQLTVVRAIGCDLVQGYFFAPAMAPGLVLSALTEGYRSARAA